MRSFVRIAAVTLVLGLVVLACGGETITGGTGDAGGSSSGGSGGSSGPNGSSSGGGSGGSSGANGSASGSGGGAPVCTPAQGSASGGPGMCSITDEETCGITGYEIQCDCPQATCTCTCCGMVVHTVKAPTCPVCPSAAQAYELCGFPHY